MSRDLRRKLTLIAGLYVSQAIPLGFLTVALPAILRSEGADLRDVGLVAAMATPWLFKWAWAPFVDRFGARRGHYRSWIVPLQAGAVVAVLVLAAVDPRGHLPWLLVGGLVFMLLAATQDIATDGLAVRILDRDERGRANGVQVGGYYLGQIVGGGLMLIVYHSVGWAPSLVLMAAFLALPLWVVAGYRDEPARGAVTRGVDWAALGRFFRRPGTAAWVAVLLTYRAGEGMATAMVSPLLVDLGMSLEEVGVVLGMAVSLGALSGALAGGYLVEQLGRRRALVGFGIAQAVALAFWIVPAAGLDDTPVVYAAALGSALVGGMATAALYTAMMDRAATSSAATDFTVQQSLFAVGPLVAASLSGFVARAVGYPLHFLLAAAATAGAVFLVLRLPEDDSVAEPVAADA